MALQMDEIMHQPHSPGTSSLSVFSRVTGITSESTSTPHNEAQGLPDLMQVQVTEGSFV